MIARESIRLVAVRPCPQCGGEGGRIDMSERKVYWIRCTLCRGTGEIQAPITLSDLIRELQSVWAQDLRRLECEVEKVKLRIQAEEAQGS